MNKKLERLARSMAIEILKSRSAEASVYGSFMEDQIMFYDATDLAPMENIDEDESERPALSHVKDYGRF